jgi:hypothetical protein
MIVRHEPLTFDRGSDEKIPLYTSGKVFPNAALGGLPGGLAESLGPPPLHRDKDGATVFGFNRVDTLTCVADPFSFVHIALPESNMIVRHEPLTFDRGPDKKIT